MILISLTLRNRQVAVIVILESRSSILPASNRRLFKFCFKFKNKEETGKKRE